MNLVLFYEKPGCATNARQKKSLLVAGCTLIEMNLLDNGMSSDELWTYLQARPVQEWFNPNAPRVKSGEVDPSAFDEASALAALLNDPILIRRPLLSINGHRLSGFDQAEVERLLGTALNATVDSASSSADESCPEPVFRIKL